MHEPLEYRVIICPITNVIEITFIGEEIYSSVSFDEAMEMYNEVKRNPPKEWRNHIILLVEDVSKARVE